MDDQLRHDNCHVIMQYKIRITLSISRCSTGHVGAVQPDRYSALPTQILYLRMRSMRQCIPLHANHRLRVPCRNATTLSCTGTCTCTCMKLHIFQPLTRDRMIPINDPPDTTVSSSDTYRVWTLLQV